MIKIFYYQSSRRRILQKRNYLQSNRRRTLAKEALSLEEHKAGVTEEKRSPEKQIENDEETLSQELEIADAIAEILNKATKELAGGYRIDDSFLLWLAGRYDRESVYALQQAVRENQGQMEDWYEITGKSLHVLWVEYCRETKMQEHYLEKVYEKECSGKDRVTMDFTGDINLAEGWSTTRYLDGTNGNIQDCFSSALWEEMQSVDILMINNEFTYSDRGEALAGKAYTFGQSRSVWMQSRKSERTCCLSPITMSMITGKRRCLIRLM